jgi:hypothetical protein
MDAFYAGCFLGASTLDRLEGCFKPLSGALVLMVLLVPVRAFLPGFGGGLGLAAFIAVMLIIALSRTKAWMTGGTLTGNRSFTVATASAMIAVFLIIGLISAVPVAEQEPISAGMTALESTAEMSDATSARLVVSKPAPGAADDQIPIGISLINSAEDDVVVLSGLPSGSRMTNGQPLATDGWQLLARDLVDAAIRPARASSVARTSRRSCDGPIRPSLIARNCISNGLARRRNQQQMSPRSPPPGHRPANSHIR